MTALMGFLKERWHSFMKRLYSNTAIFLSQTSQWIRTEWKHIDRLSLTSLNNSCLFFYRTEYTSYWKTSEYKRKSKFVQFTVITYRKHDLYCPGLVDCYTFCDRLVSVSTVYSSKPYFTARESHTFLFYGLVWLYGELCPRFQMFIVQLLVFRWEWKFEKWSLWS